MGTANKEFQQKQKASNPKKLKSEADKLKKNIRNGITLYYPFCTDRIMINPKCNICTLNCTLEEIAVLNFLREQPKATQKKYLNCMEEMNKAAEEFLKKKLEND